MRLKTKNEEAREVPVVLSLEQNGKDVQLVARQGTRRQCLLNFRPDGTIWEYGLGTKEAKEMGFQLDSNRKIKRVVKK